MDCNLKCHIPEDPGVVLFPMSATYSMYEVHSRSELLVTGICDFTTAILVGFLYSQFANTNESEIAQIFGAIGVVFGRTFLSVVAVNIFMGMNSKG